MKILIADDDPMQRELLKGFLEHQGYAVVAAVDGAEAVRRFRGELFQLVLLDQRMPGLSGDRALAEIKALNPQARAFLITAYGDVETAVGVMKLGADDFLEKPVDLHRLLEMIRQLEEELGAGSDAAEVQDALAALPTSFADAGGSLPLEIVGDGPAMREVLSLVRRVAATPWSVLIRGETGTGKELVARLIHLLGAGQAAPFVAVNCAAIPENLFESELFGHERGAFTGADRQHKGRFGQAAGGTLLLDEVGELSAASQAKLLRALQERQIHRVGGAQAISIDARVVTATNNDLKRAVETGTFREDLLFRLNVFEIEVPPLRQRREDILPLFGHFLQRYARRALTVSPEAEDLLIKYGWPGNVRELEHLVQRVSTLARGSVLRAADLPTDLRMGGVPAGSLQERLDYLERELIEQALQAAGGVQTRAAENLGISERVLRYKLAKHGIGR